MEPADTRGDGMSFADGVRHFLRRGRWHDEDGETSSSPTTTDDEVPDDSALDL
jgi:hypothetical protein